MIPSDALSKRVKKDLDARIVDIELTLIAIIQAVPLVILADKALDPILHMDWQVLPYVGVGLATILIFWSRALIHVLSFIAWPLDFTHNFLYIVATLVQSIMVAQVSNPQQWFALGIAYSILLWITCAVDLRVIGRQMKSAREVNEQLLLADVIADQLRNVRFYMPAVLIFCVVSFLAIHHRPDIFIKGHWHIALATIQFLVSLVYLWEGYLILRRRNQRIFQRLLSAEAE